MHLQCPTCQQTLEVPEQYIGHQMQCPLCKNNFTVPGGTGNAQAISPTPAPAYSSPPTQQQQPAPKQAPPTHQGTEPPVFDFAEDPEPAPPPQAPQSTGYSSTPPPPPPPQEEEPAMLLMSEDDYDQGRRAPHVSPGEYRKTRTIWISPRVIPWFPPICMTAIFIFSFLPWVAMRGFSLNVWSMTGWFITYGVFVIIAMVFSIITFLWHLGVIPDLPQLQAIKPFRSLIVGSLIAFGFVLVALKFFVDLVGQGLIPYSFWGHFSVMLHFIALITIFLQFCLERRSPSQPIPRIDFKW